MALNPFRYIRSFFGMPREGPIPPETQRTIKHGYYACVSYIDAQIGILLDELERLKLADRTVVVVWSDHGYQLGEHGMICKHTNFETSVLAPLILRVPGLPTAGEASDALVELVDLYPTLAELADLSLPDHLEGTSMKPLLADPQRAWKSAAFSQYARGQLGRSLRTERYRYTEWRDPASGEVTARELYDHAVDPQENRNVAGKTENRAVVAVLAERLRRGWQAARPSDMAEKGR
jgi:arylsulfatase A-like enzyme